jgi:hypothetical protein
MSYQEVKMSPEELLTKLAAGECVKIDGWSISKTDLSFGPIIETTNPYGCGSGTSSMTLSDCSRMIKVIDDFNAHEEREKREAALHDLTPNHFCKRVWVHKPYDEICNKCGES